MLCSLCGSRDGNPWIAIVVIEDDENRSGMICSTGCLIDFAAKVSALELAA